MRLSRIRVPLFVLALLPFDFVVGVALLLSEFARLPLVLLRPPSLKFPHVDPASVTLQIVNWDGRQLLEEFLPGVLEAAGGCEVLVVDNGSSDGSVELLRSRFPRVRVLALDANHGFGGGNNRGVREVKTDIVVFLNNDMAVERGFLEPLLRPFSDPSVFAVASRITVPDPEKAHHETGKTRARFETGQFYLWHDPIGPADEERPAMPVFWAGGGACAVDRRRFESLGGFDMLYHPFYVEDTDLSYQAWKRGWKSLLAPQSRVLHRHRSTSGPRFGDFFVNNTTRRNHYLLVWKNVTDFGMLAEHLIQLPVLHAQAIRQYGAAFEVRAYLRACLRLPRAIRRRLANAGSYGVGDRDVLDLTQ